MLLVDARHATCAGYLGGPPERDVLDCVQQALTACDAREFRAPIVLGPHEVRLALMPQCLRASASCCTEAKKPRFDAG
jgi:hypothetical protein